MQQMFIRCSTARVRHLILLSLQLVGCSESPSVSLTTKRLGHSSELIGNYLYVFGGGNLDSVERATVHEDGDIDTFTTLPDVKLTTTRTSHTSAVIGDSVYLFGGAAGSSYASTSIERATINSDGSLGTFVPTSSVSLAVARGAHAMAATQDFVYVIGGGDGGTGARDSVERAPIKSDGSLGSFTIEPGVTLRAARRNFDAEVLGNYLYVFGGSGTSGALDSIERAAIAPDGSLGAFETLVDVKLSKPSFDHAFVHTTNGRLFAIGGLSGEAVPSKDVAASTQAADGTLAPFATVSAHLACARGSHTATVIKDFVYVIGGLDPSGITTSVERAAITSDGSLGEFESLSE